MPSARARPDRGIGAPPKAKQSSGSHRRAATRLIGPGATSGAESSTAKHAPLASSLAPRIRVDPGGPWGWLNRRLEIRYARLCMVGFGGLLVVYLAYVNGRAYIHPVADEVSHEPLLHPQPEFKAPFRINSTTVSPEQGGSPEPGEQPNTGNARLESQSGGLESGSVVAADGQKHADGGGLDSTAVTPPQLWGIVIHQGPDLVKAEKLMKRLDMYETDFKLKSDIATITEKNRRSYLVYFGPFASQEEARKLVPRVQGYNRIPGGTRISEAYVREIQPPR